MAAQNQQLTSWLAARHLHTGLSGYWESNVVTLTSGDRVRIRPVARAGGRLTPQHPRIERGLVRPGPEYGQLRRALPRYGRVSRLYPGAAVLATFGKPARTYHVGPYTVLVWNRICSANSAERTGTYLDGIPR